MYNLGVMEQDAILTNVTDMLDNMENAHNTVLYGTENKHVKGILARPGHKDDPRLKLFYSDGCQDFVDPTGGALEDCSTVSNGILAQGLSAGSCTVAYTIACLYHPVIH